MVHPPIDKLLERIDSKYALVIVAAKRARQLNTYHHQLGEGNIDTFAPPMVESRSKNYLTMALEEIAQGTPTEEVARKLHVSPHTVRTHIKNILRKLDARTRAHAVAIALSEEAIEGLDPDAGS